VIAGIVATLAATVPVLAGCGGDELTSGAAQAGEVEVGRLPRITSPALPNTPDLTAPDLTAPTTAVSVDDTVPSIGMPGIDADQAVCAAWSRLAGTRQVLTLAAIVADLDEVALVRLEVIAAPSVLRSALQFEAALIELDDPAVVAERDVVVGELVGPLSRRAASITAALAQAGAVAADEDRLATLWLDGLRAVPPDAVMPPLADLGAVLGPLVDAVAEQLAGSSSGGSSSAGSLPTWTDDADLDISTVEAPATLELLTSECSDTRTDTMSDAQP